MIAPARPHLPIEVPDEPAGEISDELAGLIAGLLLDAVETEAEHPPTKNPGRGEQDRPGLNQERLR